MRNRFDSHDYRYRDEQQRREQEINYDDRNRGFGTDDYRTTSADNGSGRERGFGMANGRDAGGYDHFDRGGYERPDDNRRYGGRDAGMWSRYDYASERGNSLRSGGYNPDRSYGGQEHFQPAQFERARGTGMGRPPKGYTRSDERIREDVCDRIGMDHDASEVEVKVEGGVVTLTGTVTDRETKYALEEISERVSGVKDVQNQVTLLRGKASPLSTTQRMESHRGVELGHMDDGPNVGNGRRRPSTPH